MLADTTCWLRTLFSKVSLTFILAGSRKGGFITVGRSVSGRNTGLSKARTRSQTGTRQAVDKSFKRAWSEADTRS